MNVDITTSQGKSYNVHVPSHDSKGVEVHRNGVGNVKAHTIIKMTNGAVYEYDFNVTHPSSDDHIIVSENTVTYNGGTRGKYTEVAQQLISFDTPHERLPPPEYNLLYGNTSVDGADLADLTIDALRKICIRGGYKMSGVMSKQDLIGLINRSYH